MSLLNKLYGKCKKEIIVICLLSFLFGLCFALNLRVLQCLNHLSKEDKNYAHDIKNQIKDNRDNYIVLIFSSPYNEKQRNAIRSSWMKLVRNIHLVNGKRTYQWNNTKHKNKHTFLKFIFVIGTKNLTNELTSKLEIENRNFSDMYLMHDFIDGYNKLTEKMLLAMKWCSNNFPYLKYVIKCDDDSFVRIDMIVAELEEYGPYLNNQKYISSKGLSVAGNGLLWGFFNGNATVYLKGKWQERQWFLCDRYLPYALGGGYVISKSIVDYIGNNDQMLSQYYAEDVSMGVWTAPLKIHRVHDIRFNTEWISRSCANFYLITHKHSSERIMQMYNNLLASEGKVLCTKQYGLQHQFLYNWNVLPGKSKEYLKEDALLTLSKD